MRHRLAHNGLQLFKGGTAQLMQTGEVLQQSKGLDPANPGYLLHQSEDERV